jgi:arylsulfatase A-like enzyme
VPHQCDGHTLLPFVHATPPGEWRREAHWEYDFRDVARWTAAQKLGIAADACNLAVIRDDDYAYVHFAALPPLLFDLKNDPHWLRNVADDPACAAVALRYARRMLDWRLRHADRTLTGFAATDSGLKGSL